VIVVLFLVFGVKLIADRLPCAGQLAGLPSSDADRSLPPKFGMAVRVDLDSVRRALEFPSTRSRRMTCGRLSKRGASSPTPKHDPEMAVLVRLALDSGARLGSLSGSRGRTSEVA
jgi:hypothetical protein